MTARVYPLPRADNDPRFTFGLALEVGAVLVKHGYPAPSSADDFTALQQALFGFLYRPIEPEDPR